MRVATPVTLRRISLRLRAEGHEARHLARTRAGRWLIGAVAAILVLTLLGLLALWPYGWNPGPSVSRTVPATVQRVTDADCGGGTGATCRTITVAVGGRTARLGLGPVRNAPDVGPGAHVRLLDVGARYEFAEVDRRGSLVWLAVVLAVVAAAFLRWRGVLAIVGVALSFALVVRFLVPAILGGRPALLVALVTALAVMFVTVGLTHGLGTQALAAVLGITATLALTCGLALLAVRFAHLDGTSELDMLSVKAGSETLSLQGVILAAMIIGAAMLMRVETTFRIMGYPGLAMLFFLGAAFGASWMAFGILRGDQPHTRRPT